MLIIAAVVVAGSAAAETAGNSAALLHAGLPGENADLVSALKEQIEDAGYAVAELDAQALCDPARLDPGAIDLLVVPNAACLPAASVGPIKAFLEAGGDLIALNAPLWQTLLITPAGAWVSYDDYQGQTAADLPDHMLFKFAPEDIPAWRRTHFPTDGVAVYETVEDGPAPGRRSLHAKIEDLKNWDNFGCTDLAQPFPEGDILTVFSAKGGSNTRSLAVEWQETDGSRWIATVPLSPEWRRYALLPEDFKFWESVPGRSGDRFHPENAKGLYIGMAFTHTGVTPGPQEYWVSYFGTARMSDRYKDLLARPAIPPMETLAPGYKFFDCHEVASLNVRDNQAIIGYAPFDVPKALRSLQPRPGGGGFDKGRDWRWIPLLEATTEGGEWRGTPATLMVHASGPFAGGQWAAFGVADTDWYRRPSVMTAVGQVAGSIRRGVYIIDGGADFYTYFPDQAFTLGLRVANLGRALQAGLEARVFVVNLGSNTEEFRQQWSFKLDPDAGKSVSVTWRPVSWPQHGFGVTAQISQNGILIDTVSHKVYAWKPKDKKSYVTIQDGDFMLDGKRWRAHGVNYMPSSGIGAEDGPYFEQWLGARSYDPEIIERDLRHVRDLGLNAVSIFIYEASVKAQNLLDILRICDELGLKANLSLRPGTIGDFQWPGMQAAIEYYRLWENDTVFAYDLDWEPMWRQHDKRTKWDKAWESWIGERYGSIENAERDWKFPVPRDYAGNVTNPDDKQILEDGDGRVLVAAYRRFLDTLLYKEYSGIRARVRAVDPNHFVSFRMTEAGDPTMNWGGVLPYDFPYLAAAVDILEPEGYGRIGDWEKVKPGWFEYEYARWAAPKLPMLWAESGVSAWDIGAGASPPTPLDHQGEFYRDFYRMMIGSGADGIFWWWYPGGFRVGENSDYGIINCDGSDRPSSKAIRDNARAFIDGPPAKPVDSWIEIDRDRYPNGVAGVYNAVKDEFWKAIADGHTPGLKTAGTGTNSANCPLLAVGNTPCDGTNPPKYLDAFFDSVEVRDRQGRWVKVENGDAIEIAADKPVLARMTITNLGEAQWLNDGPGAVYVTAAAAGQTTRKPLPKPVPHLGSVSIAETALVPPGLNQPTQITVTLLADGRTPFGGRFAVRICK